MSNTIRLQAVANNIDSEWIPRGQVICINTSVLPLAGSTLGFGAYATVLHCGKIVHKLSAKDPVHNQYFINSCEELQLQIVFSVSIHNHLKVKN